jgi:predicted dehydrogenase
MRLALIGCTGHWHTNAPGFETTPDLGLVAIAPAGPDETFTGFEGAPGLTDATRKYESATDLLDHERLDAVQVSARPDRNAYWSRACLERDIPVLTEKPMAMNTAELEGLYAVACKSHAPILPMHTERGSDMANAMRRAIADGMIGTPLLVWGQKTYRWGPTRPDYYRDRATFPGVAPYIGIHLFDWVRWMVGDMFTAVSGAEGTNARPDYHACASHAAVLLSSDTGITAALTLDYLRPLAAPTHGDERLRIAGTGGVIEMSYLQERVTLIQRETPPRNLPIEPAVDLFTQFARNLRGEGPPVMTREEPFRTTEIAILAQEAIDTRRTVTLRDSPYREKA